jgi:methionyl-tRNA formyltransferase
MRISLLTDDPSSWFVPYGKNLVDRLAALGHASEYFFDSRSIPRGDICFLLSCTKMVNRECLGRNVNNIVVHASDLPLGRGFSPLQWQILGGQSDVVLTLFEAVEELDAGPHYLKSTVHYEGTELLGELRQKMAESIIALCINYAVNRDALKPIAQSGTATFFPRRVAKDDELDASSSIVGVFNHLRIADNDKHPVFFNYKGRKYYLKIYADPVKAGAPARVLVKP